VNERDIEARLRDGLQRVLPPEPPASLFGHVGRLGVGDPQAAVEWRHSRGGRRVAGPVSLHMGRGARAFLELAAGLAIVGAIGAGLVLRPMNGPLPPAAPTATRMSAPPTGRLGQSPSTSVPVPASPATAWQGPPARIIVGGRRDAGFGWMVTHDPVKLLVTADNGASWRDVTPAELADKFQALGVDGAAGPRYVTFLDAQHGWFNYDERVGTGNVNYAHYLYSTTNGATTWSRAPIPAAPEALPVGLQVLDASHLIAHFRGARNQLWASADGGSSWALMADVPIGPATAFPDRGLTFLTPLEGWGILGANQLTRTTDGGKTWKSARLPYDATSYSLDIASYPGEFPGREPSNAAGQMLFTAVVSAAGQGDSISNALVTWLSLNGGASWGVYATRQLGGGMELGVSWNWIVLLHTASLRVEFIDIDDLNVRSTVDVSKLCKVGSNCPISLVFSAWPGDIWLTRLAGASSPATSYLYGTSDAGKTWRPLMGAPQP
jgi:photosystem II stability/assembly factor-like uncharacterized protein